MSLIVFGILSLIQIPKESTPKIELPMAIIITSLPGASAYDVEQLITDKIEKTLDKNLENIKNIKSESRNDISKITVEFKIDTDIKKAIDELKDEIDKIKNDLPEDATEPEILKINFAKQPVLTFAIGAKVPQEALLYISKSLKKELEQLPDISKVEISGVPEREIYVLAKREKLAKYGLTLTDIANAIQAQNVTMPGGTLNTNNTEYTVRFDGDIKSIDEMSKIPILSVEKAPVTLREVATIIDGFSKPEIIVRTSINGSPSVNAFMVNVYKKADSQITSVGVSVKNKLKELQQPGGLLYGMSIVYSTDRAQMLYDDLFTLGTSGLVTVVLVMTILFATIGAREALLAGIAIPLSFLMSFIGLQMTGNSINFVSLFALILATGIIVDSAIVIVEGINTKIKQHSKSTMPSLKSSWQTLKQYHAPLTSGTLTTIAVFIPLFTISGVTGEFISVIPYTIIFVLASSLFTALAIVPTLGVLFIKPHNTKSKFEHIRKTYISKINTIYERFLTDFLSDKRNSNTMIAIMIVLFVSALTLPIIGAIKVEFFPRENSKYVFIEIELDNNTSLEKTDLEIRKIEELIYDVYGIKSFSAIAGQSSPFSDVFSGIRKDSKIGTIIINLNEKSGMKSVELINVLRTKLQNITTSDILVGQMEEGPPIGAPIVITFYGNDLQYLDDAANNAKAILENIYGTTAVKSTTKDNSSGFVITTDKLKSITNGVTPLSIARNIHTALSGTKATSIKLSETDIPVTVKMEFENSSIAPYSNHATIDVLRSLPLGTVSGTQQANLNKSLIAGSFINAGLEQSRSVIKHENTKRISQVTGRLQNDANTKIVTDEFVMKMQEKKILPNDIYMKIGGENEEVDQSFADMFTALFMGIFAMFTILMVQFNSFKHTIYILLTVPLSLIGVFIGLLIMNKSLSFPAIMGFIALSGIVVNNGIILIDVINRKRAEFVESKKGPMITRKIMSDFETGKCETKIEKKYDTVSETPEELRSIIIESAKSRLRPIILTVITTVSGILPLVFVAEIWAPLGYSVVFGLLFATVITLIILPAIYYYGALKSLKSIE